MKKTLILSSLILLFACKKENSGGSNVAITVDSSDYVNQHSKNKTSEDVKVDNKSKKKYIAKKDGEDDEAFVKRLMSPGETMYMIPQNEPVIKSDESCIITAKSSPSALCAAKQHMILQVYVPAPDLMMEYDRLEIDVACLNEHSCPSSINETFFIDIDKQPGKEIILLTDGVVKVQDEKKPDATKDKEVSLVYIFKVTPTGIHKLTIDGLNGNTAKQNPVLYDRNSFTEKLGTLGIQ